MEDQWVRCPRVAGRDVGADGFQTLGSLLPRRIAETAPLKPSRVHYFHIS